MGCWVRSKQGGKYTHKERTGASQKPKSDELNDKTAQRWCLKKGKTYQIQNKIHDEDIAVFWEEAYIQLDPLNSQNGKYEKYVTETLLSREIKKVDGITSVFNNRHISQEDKATSLALHQQGGENTKQKEYITSTGYTIPTKITEQYPNGVHELILNDTRVFCQKSPRLKYQNIARRNCNINSVQKSINHTQKNTNPDQPGQLQEHLQK